MKEILIYLTPNSIILLLALVLLMGAGLFLMKGPKNRKSYRKTGIFTAIYDELTKLPIVKNYVKKKTMQLSAMSVYSKEEIKSKASLYFIISFLTFVVSLLVGIFIYDDYVSVALVGVGGYIIPTIVIEKNIKRMHGIVSYQLKYAIESLRLEYLKCNDVIEALEHVDYGKRLTKAFSSLHEILTSAGSDTKIKEYNESIPFIHMQTLAQVCYHVNNTGDTFDENGYSSFVNALLIMMKDLNDEIGRLTYQKTKFGKLEYLCLVAIPATKVMEVFLLSSMPGTAIILKGILGYIFKIIIIVISLTSYTYVARANSMSFFKNDDRNMILNRLLKRRLVFSFAKQISPKNMVRVQFEQKLNDAFSKKSVEEFYLGKAVLSSAIFVFSMICVLSSINIGRDYMRNNSDSLSLIKENPTYEYDHDDIISMDNYYMRMRDKGYIFENEEIRVLITDTITGITDMDIESQISRMKTKYDYLSNLYFRWWFIPICFLLSIGVWFIPNRRLKKRIEILNIAAEEEFLQIQTITTILMSINCDTMEAIGYLSELVTIHKDMFLYCYLGYASDPEKELDIMEIKTPIQDFKRYIRKLKLTINELSMEDAFADLKIDREHISRMRDEKLRDNIDRKRNECGLITKIGLSAAIVLLFVFPLMYIGYTNMMDGLKTLQGL
ncbi:hypothetical protein acsn021_06570 [Anaerocolumna cellulosilytica]|uniref:Uncharacterized protein n=1 Tax=Anaerocolumna cellulosilytica TaxID=433286 RepID=A0A6S6R243_9FIRM|nr:hypothetical protein [Anaerocolumna cellulosilytica]MBB5197688.1 hypothetical protein [Anaerocolumna cellulosilytica]BCJ93088.1 hypothetical protein acsn021_06570 [Anaerocolumna cellulosilytica]